MAQALERAGDHTTNLAEELYSLIEGQQSAAPTKETGVQLVVGPAALSPARKLIYPVVLLLNSAST